MTEFDLLKCWNNRDEESIKNQIRNIGEFDLCVCHFDSDLLIIHHPNFSEMELCYGLCLHYDNNFGANTFLNEDMILNISKVKGGC